MERMLLTVLLLSVHILMVSTAPVVPEQIGCAEGEPSVGDPEPDVNITVLPSLTIPEMSKISVVCNAGNPGFGVTAYSGTSLPPTKILIYVGKYKVKECGDGITSTYQCIYGLSAFFAVLPREISCTAINAELQCRFKTVSITLISVSPTTANMTTTTLSSTSPPPGTNASTEKMTTTPLVNTTGIVKSSGERCFSTSYGLLALIVLLLL